MKDVLQNIGLIAIVWVLLYTTKKVYAHYEMRRIGEGEDEEITRLAEEYVRNQPSRKS
ncbi:hypothetical protein D3C73_1168350 [compost metagenome]